MKSVQVTKASGVKEPFSIQKLRTSLKRAGAPDSVTEEIIAELQPGLYDGISTKKLYAQAHRLLRRLSAPEAARYHLKRAIMQLGPSGFPFEKFIARIFEENGFLLSTNLFLTGKCVQHEIDVIGRRGEEGLIAECKYHNRGGVAVDVKVPLYVQSRFEDILAGKDAGFTRDKFERWVITNARFTSDAITYGTCAGLNLMSWDYPLHGSLRDRIDKTSLYPLTCLVTLSTHDKQLLLRSGFVLAKDLLSSRDKITQLLGDRKALKVLEEAAGLCDGNPLSKK